MSETKLLLKNSIFTFLSYLVTALVQTFIYIRAAKVLGSNLFGVWSFIYSGALVLGLSNVGLPNLIINYSAKFLAVKDYSNLTKYLINSFFLFFITFPLILLITSIIFYFAIGNLHIVSLGTSTYFAFALLFLLQNICGLLFAFIDGIQMMYIRSTIQSISNIFFLVMTFLLLKKGQLNSLVLCQIIFYIIQVITIIIYLLYWFRARGFQFIIYAKFSRAIFIEILIESRNYFLIASSTIFFEPLARFLIGKYIGISSISYYEIANRIIGGVKTLYVNLSQSLLPYFSFKSVQTKENSFLFLKKITNVIFYISVPVFFLLPICVFYYNNLFFSSWNKSISYLVIATCAGSFMNIICAPSYFFLMATNQSKLNLINHFSYFIFLILFTFLSFIFKMQIFILIAPALSLYIGSYLIIFLLKRHLNNKSNLLDSCNRFTMNYLLIFYTVCFLYIKFEHSFMKILIITSIPLFLFFYFLQIKKRIFIIISSLKNN